MTDPDFTETLSAFTLESPVRNQPFLYTDGSCLSIRQRPSTIRLRNDMGHQIPANGKTYLDATFPSSRCILMKCMLPAEKAGNELLFSLLPGLDKHISIEEFRLQRQTMQDAAWPHVALLPGASKLIRHLHSNGIPMAVATGSIKRNYLFKVAHEQCDKEKVEVFRLFGDNVICGDDSRVVRPKPAPDIFLTAAVMVGKDVGLAEGDMVTEEEKMERSRCLVFEDGIPGVQAAQRAGMQGRFSKLLLICTMVDSSTVVWIPDTNLLSVNTKLDVTPLSSLEDFRPEEYGLPPYNS